jgi:hypothetical protein
LHDFAKWKILAFRANPNEFVFFDGVIVQVNAAGIVPEDVERADKAAEALISELNKTKIASRMHAGDSAFPLGTIVVRVGMKPNPALERIEREWEEERRRQQR